MKKLFLSLAILLAGATTLVSCDPVEFLDSLMGSANLVVSNDSTVSHYYNNGDTLDLSCCVNDYLAIDTFGSTNLYIGSNVNLLESTVISTPYIALNLSDTTTTSYIFGDVVTANSIANLSANNLITSLAGTNALIVVACDSVYYISHSGTAQIDNYASYGSVGSVTLTNVQAYYITKSKIDYLKDLIDSANAGDTEAITTLATLNLDQLFPTVTFNGTLSGRRFPVSSIANALLSSN